MNQQYQTTTYTTVHEIIGDEIEVFDHDDNSCPLVGGCYEVPAYPDAVVAGGQAMRVTGEVTADHTVTAAIVRADGETRIYGRVTHPTSTTWEAIFDVVPAERDMKIEVEERPPYDDLKQWCLHGVEEYLEKKMAKEVASHGGAILPDIQILFPINPVQRQLPVVVLATAKARFLPLTSKIYLLDAADQPMEHPPIQGTRILQAAFLEAFTHNLPAELVIPKIAVRVRSVSHPHTVLTKAYTITG